MTVPSKRSGGGITLDPRKASHLNSCAWHKRVSLRKQEHNITVIPHHDKRINLQLHIT